MRAFGEYLDMKVIILIMARCFKCVAVGRVDKVIRIEVAFPETV